MPEVKERPILFSGPMVRAIISGQKTVTRRAVSAKLTSQFDEPRGQTDVEAGYPFVECHDGFHPATEFCPYGQPGDRLWVRETWARVGNCDPGYLTFAATYPGCLPPELENIPPASEIRWKPSIHMFRRDSRILLEITDMRVERLHGISEEQAQAEGIDLDRLADGQAAYDMVADHNMTGRPTAVGAFSDLWASINGIENWDANPWVWVVEFKRVTQ